LADYKHLLDGVVPIDGAIAMNALTLVAKASKRIPMVDALIAAVAWQKQATLQKVSDTLTYFLNFVFFNRQEARPSWEI